MWKMALSTTFGHTEHCIMPCGLSCTLAVFQGLINDVLHDIIGKFIIVSINDIVIYFPSKEDHVPHVRRVLSWLLENQLEKCEFHGTPISFLSHIISQEGVLMDQDKVTAVTKWSTPTTVQEIQRFLGFNTRNPGTCKTHQLHQRKVLMAPHALRYSKVHLFMYHLCLANGNQNITHC